MASREKDTGKMQAKKEAVLNSVLSQLPESQKKDFTKAANSVAFTGFGTLASAAEECKNPKRDLNQL